VSDRSSTIRKPRALIAVALAAVILFVLSRGWDGASVGEREVTTGLRSPVRGTAAGVLDASSASLFIQSSGLVADADPSLPDASTAFAHASAASTADAAPTF